MDSFVKHMPAQMAAALDLPADEVRDIIAKVTDAFEVLFDDESLRSHTVEELVARLRPFIFANCMLLRKGVPPGVTFFRARKIDRQPQSIADVSHPPRGVVNTLGRFNRAGEPRFYASMARAAACLELRPEQGDWIALSVWETVAPVWLEYFGYSKQVFSDLESKHFLTEANSELDEFEQVLARNPISYVTHNLMARVFASKGGELAFKATVALSECIAAHYASQNPNNEAAALVRSVAIGGVMYPTVNSAGNGDNVALLPEFADRCLALRQVQWGVVMNPPQGLKFDYGITDVSRAIAPDGAIQWIGNANYGTLPIEVRRQILIR